LWRLPPEGALAGLAGIDKRSLGLPEEADYVEKYCEARHHSSNKGTNYETILVTFKATVV